MILEYDTAYPCMVCLSVCRPSQTFFKTKQINAPRIRIEKQTVVVFNDILFLR